MFHNRNDSYLVLLFVYYKLLQLIMQNSIFSIVSWNICLHVKKGSFQLCWRENMIRRLEFIVLASSKYNYISSLAAWNDI